MSEIVDYCTGGIVVVPNEEVALNQKITLQGDLLSGANAEAAMTVQSRAWTFSRLRVLVLNHSRGEATVKLVKDGIQPNPTLEVSFDNNDTFPQLFEDVSHTVSFSAGDSFRYSIILESATGETRLSYISVQVEFD